MPSPQYPRTFVAADDPLDTWAAIEPYFDKLAARNLDTPETLTRWLHDLSELSAGIDEVGTDRHVRMTCHTDDPARKSAYLDFIENIEPRCKPRFFELQVKYTRSPAAAQLPTERYGVLDRSIRASVDIFREENVPLQTEEAKLQQQYQEICGRQTVQFDGSEKTMPQLAPYLERTDRTIRREAWEVGAARRLEDADAIEDIFEQLIRLRHQMAVRAGGEDYRAYAFRAKQRFDYTPQDCIAFHDAVEKTAVPAMLEVARARREALGLERLRPWDLAVDVKGRPPLAPFSTPGELCRKASRVFHRVDPALGNQFDEMVARGYLDLESRKGKAPGAYQATYEESRRPFIFMSAVGVQADVRTLIHEGGHAFHCYAARHDPLVRYRSSPIEFAEVASFGMEMLALEFLDEFYDPDGVARAKRQQLEGILFLIPWIATIDAFQHFLYAQPDHSRNQRREHWLALRDRFGGDADFTGYEEALGRYWQRQLHLFTEPFYYIEYGIAKLGALQLWSHARSDRAGAVAAYRQALSLGGSRPLPELFEAAGARFDFSHETLAPLIDQVQSELARLPV